MAPRKKKPLIHLSLEFYSGEDGPKVEFKFDAEKVDATDIALCSFATQTGVFREEIHQMIGEAILEVWGDQGILDFSEAISYIAEKKLEESLNEIQDGEDGLGSSVSLDPNAPYMSSYSTIHNILRPLKSIYDEDE